MESLTPQEQGDVEMMISMMGGDLSPQVALNLLRKHNGSIEKAASALLEGDRGSSSDAMAVSPSSASRPPLRQGTPLQPDKNVIDLTREDEENELTRALRASLQDQAPVFGPSNRAPDPNWAMVPSNVETAVGMSQDDQSLSKAIEASLKYDHGNDVFEEVPMEERIRKGDRPVALRPTQGSLAYAALILHGLFFIPQVKHALAPWRPYSDASQDAETSEKIGLPSSGPELTIWSLMEIFVNMDLAQMNELNADNAITAFAAEHWSTPVERPGDVSFHFYKELAYVVEPALDPDDISPSHLARLFHFRYGNSQDDLSAMPFDRRVDLAVVRVDIRGTEDTNDLVSCLATELGLADPAGDPARQQAIHAMSEVVAFQLVRDNAAPPTYSAASGAGRVERTPFRYPKHVHLDQFMKENLLLANQKRERQRSLYAEVDALVAKKQSLTRFKDRDILADLQSSLHYYEEIAEHGDDPERKSALHETSLRLRKILTRIQNELQTIEASITDLRKQAAKALECPELQQQRYDLRVVLVHDGLYGRNHIYSYVRQGDVWWKTVDHVVNEVPEETVLNDTAGLHLGAGPYFLIYSRALPEEQENVRVQWVEQLKNSVKHNNALFLSTLPPEVVADLRNSTSPPSSPCPSEFTMSSNTAEPPTSREEPMDLVD